MCLVLKLWHHPHIHIKWCIVLRLLLLLWREKVNVKWLVMTMTGLYSVIWVSCWEKYYWEFLKIFVYIYNSIWDELGLATFWIANFLTFCKEGFPIRLSFHLKDGNWFGTIYFILEIKITKILFRPTYLWYLSIILNIERNWGKQLFSLKLKQLLFSQ